MPVGPARIWSSVLKNSDGVYETRCRNCETRDGPWNNWMYKRSTSVADYQEHTFVKFWLQEKLPKNEKIIHIRSSVHVGNQIVFEIRSQPDLYVVTQDRANITHVYIVHYDGTYW